MDIERMERAVLLPTNAVDRHYLLATLVSHFYMRRDIKARRASLHHYGALHLAELPTLWPQLLAHNEGLPVKIDTFPQMEMAYCEDAHPERAVAMWEAAAVYGYSEQMVMEAHRKAIDSRMRRMGGMASERDGDG
jgi:hypothetical protein